jgi:hypothetical protein
MKFGIDFDDTITPDPRLWTDIIKLMLKHGHEAVIVTYRCQCSKNLDIKQFVRRLPVGAVDVVYTARFSKYEYAIEHDLGIDVWIDDNPFFVVNDIVPGQKAQKAAEEKALKAREEHPHG